MHVEDGRLALVKQDLLQLALRQLINGKEQSEASSMSDGYIDSGYSGRFVVGESNRNDVHSQCIRRISVYRYIGEVNL